MVESWNARLQKIRHCMTALTVTKRYRLPDFTSFRYDIYRLFGKHVNDLKYEAYIEENNQPTAKNFNKIDITPISLYGKSSARLRNCLVYLDRLPFIPEYLASLHHHENRARFENSIYLYDRSNVQFFSSSRKRTKPSTNIDRMHEMMFGLFVKVNKIKWILND